jgi:hypothetical protein
MNLHESSLGIRPEGLDAVDTSSAIGKSVHSVAGFKPHEAGQMNEAVS